MEVRKYILKTGTGNFRHEVHCDHQNDRSVTNSFYSREKGMVMACCDHQNNESVKNSFYSREKGMVMACCDHQNNESVKNSFYCREKGVAMARSRPESGVA